MEVLGLGAGVQSSALAVPPRLAEMLARALMETVRWRIGL